MTTLEEIRSLGGKATAAKLGPEGCRERASKGGRARWANATQADRTEQARKMLEGRRQKLLRLKAAEEKEVPPQPEPEKEYETPWEI